MTFWTIVLAVVLGNYLAWLCDPLPAKWTQGILWKLLYWPVYTWRRWRNRRANRRDLVDVGRCRLCGDIHANPVQ